MKTVDKKILIGFGVVMLVGIIAVVATLQSASAPSQQSSEKDRETAEYWDAVRSRRQLQAEERLATLRSTGMLRRLDVDANQAHVDPALWRGSNIETKQGIARFLAEHCGQQGSTAQIEIYDWMSGRRLARYSRAFGWRTD